MSLVHLQAGYGIFKIQNAGLHNILPRMILIKDEYCQPAPQKLRPIIELRFKRSTFTTVILFALCDLAAGENG
jgi:hypothetical protein